MANCWSNTKNYSTAFYYLGRMFVKNLQKLLATSFLKFHSTLISLSLAANINDDKMHNESWLTGLEVNVPQKFHFAGLIPLFSLKLFVVQILMIQQNFLKISPLKCAWVLVHYRYGERCLWVLHDYTTHTCNTHYLMLHLV